MSSQPVGAHGPVACAMSPTTVMEPESERRASMRSCIGERPCTSSTTMWPKDGFRRRNRSSDGAWASATRPGPAARTPTSCAGPRRPAAPGTRGRARRRARAACAPRRSRAVSPTVHGTASSDALRGRYRRATSARGEDALAGGEERPGPEQVVEELVGRQPGPHAVERLGHLGHTAEPLRQVVLLLLARPLLAGLDAAPGEPGPVVVGQGAHDLGFDETPARVVGTGPAPGQGDDLLGRRGAQPQHARAEGHLDVAGAVGAAACARPGPAP